MSLPSHTLFFVQCARVGQVEAREKVVDPMGAAPNLPFGYLSAAWTTFIEGVRVDD